MSEGYEINDMAKEESWRMFRIIGEFVEGFDKMSGIEPAVTVYGSTRVRPGDELYEKTVEIAGLLGELGFSIVSGGGPGIMEAANKGAKQAGAISVGLNISLPQEQTGNLYTTRAISFNHFFIRKVMLVKYATAFICMPGGLGTMDELTEVLTLMQTRKIRPFPLILFDSRFWEGFSTWLRNTVLAKGFISEEDFTLLRVCDRPEEVVETVQKWYVKQEVGGKRVVPK
jgi:uncharacterized protein (TIGR00730 family)